VFEDDDFVSDLEAPDNSAGASTEIETMGHDSGTKFDNQGKEEKIVTEKDVASCKNDAATKDMSKSGATQGNEKKLAVPATTPGVGGSRPLDDAMDEVIQAAGEVPAIEDQLFNNPSSDSELVNVVGENVGEGEKPHMDALASKLDTLLNKKIEAIAIRLVEERMPSIVEPIILNTIKKLLISIE
jgi:hypothetical protein